MGLTAFVLFVVAMAAGLSVFFFDNVSKRKFSYLLVFAGSYLFSSTVLHILPELFSVQDVQYIGVMVLAGFFLQVVLEYFSSGIEHGHLHHHQGDHVHSHSTPYVLLIALCVHAFLEGTLLAHPVDFGGRVDHDHQTTGLLLGISLHKMPAAFALMSILVFDFPKKSKAILFLLIFALASPLGLGVSAYFNSQTLISETAFIYLYALVSGNFLHISTTIFFETSPEHRFNLVKLLISVSGASLALFAEFLF